MIVKFSVNFGGYYGADEEYEVEVDDNATPEEIEAAVEAEYEEILRDNCSYEILDSETEDEDDD